MKVVRVRDTDRCIGCYSCAFACARLVFKSHSAVKSAIQVRTRGGLQSKWGLDICRACTDAPCTEACTAGALVPRPGGGVIFKKAKCTRCLDCIEACVIRVISPDDENYPIICIHCGNCARFCPQEVLSVEVLKGV